MYPRMLILTLVSPTRYGRGGVAGEVGGAAGGEALFGAVSGLTGTHGGNFA